MALFATDPEPTKYKIKARSGMPRPGLRTIFLSATEAAEYDSRVYLCGMHKLDGTEYS